MTSLPPPVCICTYYNMYYLAVIHHDGILTPHMCYPYPFVLYYPFTLNFVSAPLFISTSNLQPNPTFIYLPLFHMSTALSYIYT